MTDNEIMECAENCLSESPSCLSCPFDEGTLTVDECMSKLLEKLVEVANRQKVELDKKDTEIDILIRKKESLMDKNSDLKSENERLQEELDGETVENMRLGHEVERLEGILDKRCDVCPAVITAIKEFALKVKKAFPSIAHWIDNLLKEMTGGLENGN